MKINITLLIIIFFLLSMDNARDTQGRYHVSYEDSMVYVPLGGNTWAQNADGGPGLVSTSGIQRWNNAGIRFNTYLWIARPGNLRIKMRAKVEGKSRLQVEINGVKKEVMITEAGFQWYNAGEWKVNDTGYLKISLSGISKTGKVFGDISDYEISGTAINEKTNYVKNNEGNFFYWGRRGPSVHLNFPFSDSIRAEWFYNEITVPENNDVIGSYFMADGFAEGYFGMQVNAATERRILFSVWSPFKSDDPKSVPPEMRISMLKKGVDVHAGEFGNEGSGGQSYLRYNWKAGVTYKFLLHGHPDETGNTIYTAYFFAPEKGWMLIASFKRPKTSTYLKRFHSFLENFDPEQGEKERRVLVGNQWICQTNGNWIELNKAIFTYDNTAAKGYRMDYAGGIENGNFFLKNCGFFNDYTLFRSSFERPIKRVHPEIAFSSLP